jgi:transcriptional regulator with XRE-family HTH domain
MDIGTYLREARQRQGISLHQVAGSTKLSTATLQYIERNEFDRLPGGIFTKGYLRVYAAEVGVNPQEVVDEYLAQLVARFIGAPAMNLVPATLAGIDAPSGAVIGIRPQDVTLGASGQLHAIIDLIEPRGHDYLLHLRLDAPGASPFLAVVAGGAPPPAGAEVFVSLTPDRLHLFDGPNGRRLA